MADSLPSPPEQGSQQIAAFENLGRISSAGKADLSRHGNEDPAFAKLANLSKDQPGMSVTSGELHGLSGLLNGGTAPEMAGRSKPDLSIRSLRELTDVSVHSHKGMPKSQSLRLDQTWHGNTSLHQAGAHSIRGTKPLSPLWVTSREGKNAAEEERKNHEEMRTVTDYLLQALRTGQREARNPTSADGRQLTPAARRLLAAMMPSEAVDNPGQQKEPKRRWETVTSALQQLTGTMSGLNKWLQSKGAKKEDKDSPAVSLTMQVMIGALDCCNVVLRGAAQVLLFNSPLTGVFVIAALYVQSVAIATYGVVGLLSATALAWNLGMDSGLLHSGLFGYNGILVGLALGTFQNPEDSTDGWDARLLAPVVVYSGMTVILFGALGKLLVPHGVPPYTLPFNLAALMYLSASVRMGNFSTGLDSALPEHSARLHALQDYDWHKVMEAVPKGVGQVYLADNTLSGILMIVGMLFCSPMATMAAVCGSLVGSLTGVAVGADPESVYAGLWGYNAVLGAIAIGGMFYVLELRSGFFALYCAVMCALTGPVVATIFSPFGVPAMTFPFCFMALAFHLMQGSMKGIIPVNIATASVPEEHRKRLQLTRSAAASFHALIESHAKRIALSTEDQARAASLSSHLTDESRLLLARGKKVCDPEAMSSFHAFFAGARQQGRISFDDFCLCLCHHGYGQVYERMVREMWGLVDSTGAGIDAATFDNFIALSIVIRQKRTEIDAYLEALDPNSTGRISLAAISEAMEAFGERPLTDAEQAHIAGVYSEVHHLSADGRGEVEWWRLADILQYAFMNGLVDVKGDQREA